MSQNEKKLVDERIQLVMEEVPKVEKKPPPEKGGLPYAYRSVGAVYAALSPLLIKYKLFFTPKIVNSQRDIINNKVLMYMEVEYTCTCSEDGSERVLGPFPAEAMDTSDKASYKAMSLAQKHLFISVFCISVKEDELWSSNEPPHPGPAKVQQKNANTLPKPTEAEQDRLQEIHDALLDFAAEHDLRPNMEKLTAVFYALKGKFPDEKTNPSTVAAFFANEKQINGVCDKKTDPF